MSVVPSGGWHFLPTTRPRGALPGVDACHLFRVTSTRVSLPARCAWAPSVLRRHGAETLAEPPCEAGGVLSASRGTCDADGVPWGGSRRVLPRCCGCSPDAGTPCPARKGQARSDQRRAGPGQTLPIRSRRFCRCRDRLALSLTPPRGRWSPHSFGLCTGTVGLGARV